MTGRAGPAIRRHRNRRAAGAALVAVAAALGVAAGTGAGPAAPATPAAAEVGPAAPATPLAIRRPDCATHCSPATAGPARAAAPTRVRVPRIAVDARLETLGVDAAGALVPPADFAAAGWYAGGPAPGDPGPAVIAGHLDSRDGPAVFARLAELRPGDRVLVSRGDRVVPFRVNGTLRAAKRRFPTAAVYGPTPGPELRLVTCGGDFDRRTGHYRDNVVVFAVAEPAV
ncbi:class F sortase [Micromonospora sp. NPDC126480]|uniref:class F sortase n=1 Tax=Micromonospora sp. NPDC126480 TaxID=3155312 RepID=UPI00331CA58F